MKRYYVTILLMLSFFLFCIGASAQVEQVLSYVITDEAAMIDSLDVWFASRESDYGQTSFLVSAIADGSDPTTHYLVLRYPDYASYQAAMEGVVKSGEFAKLELRVSKIATNTAESLYTPVLDNGKLEKAGDFQYTVSVNVTGPESEYVEATRELMNSEIGQKAPGIFKLVASRSGTENSHLAIISAPSFAALNEYIDSYSGNRDWENFLSKVEKISTPAGPGFLRIIRVWK